MNTLDKIRIQEWNDVGDTTKAVIYTVAAPLAGSTLTGAIVVGGVTGGLASHYSNSHLTTGSTQWWRKVGIGAGAGAAGGAIGWGAGKLLMMPFGKGTNGRPRFWGPERPWNRGATPHSAYTRLHPDTGKAIQTAIYDENGNVIAHIDFTNHRGATSGHGHLFPEPGNPASGHGAGSQHVPYGDLPDDWYVLPPGVDPITPIGQ